MASFFNQQNGFRFLQKHAAFRVSLLMLLLLSFLIKGMVLVQAQSYRFSPTSGQLTSPFGWRSDPMTGQSRFHGGIDIAASWGAPVFVPQDGIVAYSGPYKGYGNVVVVDHGQKLRTLYAHNADLYVSPGQPVKRGQVIARIGSTGRSTGPHLHFEVHVANKYVNPLEYLTYLEYQPVALHQKSQPVEFNPVGLSNGTIQTSSLVLGNKLVQCEESLFPFLDRFVGVSPNLWEKDNFYPLTSENVQKTRLPLQASPFFSS